MWERKLKAEGWKTAPLGAGNAAAFSSKNLMGKIDIWANLIRFGQNS